MHQPHLPAVSPAGSGDIDEAEWAANLKKLPLLYDCMRKDVDPDWGVLLSYRLAGVGACQAGTSSS